MQNARCINKLLTLALTCSISYKLQAFDKAAATRGALSLVQRFIRADNISQFSRATGISRYNFARPQLLGMRPYLFHPNGLGSNNQECSELAPLLSRIAQKKTTLDQLRPFPAETSKSLYQWFRIGLIYTSNAIEGNSLTENETAEIVGKGRAIGGKTLKEHLEAINHAQAVDLIHNLATEKNERSMLEAADIRTIHTLVLDKLNDDTWAGRLRTVNVRILGSQIPCPNYAKVPDLIDDFTTWLQTAQGPTPTIAADAHLKFVGIHPFVDGNGRTARLLMNLLLLQQNYPLTYIKAEDRMRYINSVQEALGKNNLTPYYQVVYEAIERSLDEYLKDLKANTTG